MCSILNHHFVGTEQYHNNVKFVSVPIDSGFDCAITTQKYELFQNEDVNGPITL